MPSGLSLALRNGTYQSISNLYYLIVRGVYIILFAKLLGVELYGAYVYSQSWYILGVAVASWGTSELFIAEAAKATAAERRQLAASGLSLRLLMGLMTTSALICIALLFEPDPDLRLLIIIYSQGVVVRGLSNWFSALFISKEHSQYWLYITVVFLTLEVVLATIMAINGAGLVEIAIFQCTIWWLSLGASWLLYRRKFHNLPLAIYPSHLRFYIANGVTLATAMLVLSLLGPGLMIICRYFVEDATQLGEAAFVTQLIVILGHMIKVSSNSALPQLNRPLPNREQRQLFFISTVWNQSIYLGGCAYILCNLLLPPLVIALVGDQFSGAARMFSQASWLLIPLLIMHGLRLVMISERQMRQYLFAILIGPLTLAAQVILLAMIDAINVFLLLNALGVAYCLIVMAMLRPIRRTFVALKVAGLVTAPLLLSIGLALLTFTSACSDGWAVAVALGLLLLASAMAFRASQGRPFANQQGR